MKRQWVRALMILAIGLFSIENLVLAINNSQNKIPVLGYSLGDKNLTGLSRDQLQKLVATELSRRTEPLRLKYQDKIIEIKVDEVEKSEDADILVNEILNTGRSGTVWEKFVNQNKALLGGNKLSLHRTLDPTLLTLKIMELQEQIDQTGQPVSLDFGHNINKVIAAKDSVEINTNELMSIIDKNIFNPPDHPIDLPITTTSLAYHNKQELLAIKNQALNLDKRPIRISSNGLAFNLHYQDILPMLTVVEVPDATNPKIKKLELRIDEKKLNQSLDVFAQSVEEKTKAEFNDAAARLAIYYQFYSQQHQEMEIPTGVALSDNSGNKVLGVNSNGPKTAYLTFDDGPNATYHPLVLDILKENNAKATFFLIGQNSQRFGDVARRTVNEGNPIGNHSLTHPFLPSLPEKAIAYELETTNQILLPINGKPLTLFRPPYGGTNAIVRKEAARLGLREYLWSVDPRDWSEPGVNEITRRIVNATTNGAIILMHSNHSQTVRALPDIIRQLRARGFSFELLG